jgi:hypothetical protein
VFVPAEGIPVGELAARARVRKQTMREAVEHLERLRLCGTPPQPRRALTAGLPHSARPGRPAGARTAGDRAEAPGPSSPPRRGRGPGSGLLGWSGPSTQPARNFPKSAAAGKSPPSREEAAGLPAQRFSSGSSRSWRSISASSGARHGCRRAADEPSRSS